jgi:indole-3-glycerol phosphate synthase
MNILDKILDVKRREIEVKRRQQTIDDLTKFPAFNSETISLSESIKNGSGIIAEYKRWSPSASKIQDKPIEEVVEFYKKHNVSGYSVLTDEEYFGGRVGDIRTAKRVVEGPVLRKDFIIDEYQLFEAKAYGADAILLIAEALDEYHALALTTMAHSIGLEVLMEFHSAEEIEKLNDAVDVIGVNNRNLKTLETRIETSEEMLKYLPYNQTKITESGIEQVNQLKFLYDLGFDGALIGESVLKSPGLLSELTAAALGAKIVNHES